MFSKCVQSKNNEISKENVDFSSHFGQSCYFEVVNSLNLDLEETGMR
jgi:hypothetical protein